MIQRLRAALTAFRSLENPRVSLSEAIDMVSGGPTPAGVKVNESSALSILAVFACVRIISETIASLPLQVYERLEKGKQRNTAHPLYSILHDRPNPEMSAMQFRELMQAHVLVWGNAYAEIETNGAGTVTGLWPLLPDRTTVQRVNQRRVYQTRLPDGSVITLGADRVFQLSGLGFDGLRGYSPVHLARNSLGLTVAAEEFGARFFGQGAAPSGLLKHPGKLGDESRKNLAASVNNLHGPLSGKHRIAVLEEGMEWQQLGIPNNHAQFLETRKFQVTEVARIFRVPPHMLADLERATFSNIEQQSIEFVTHTIRPWLVRWEQAINYDLFGSRERAKVYAEHNVDGLLRGDITSRYAAYAVGRQWGWLSADDVREFENMNPLPDGQGEIYITPLNMIPADQAGEVEPKEPPPEAPREEETPPVRAAYAGLLRNVGERMVKRELPQLRKAAKQGEAGWTQSVEAIYREQTDALTRELTPVFDALLSFGPPSARALSRASRSLAAELAASEVSLYRAALTTSGSQGAESVLAAWESSRADDFAARGADYITSLLTPSQRAA